MCDLTLWGLSSIKRRDIQLFTNLGPEGNPKVYQPVKDKRLTEKIRGQRWDSEIDVSSFERCRERQRRREVVLC